MSIYTNVLDSIADELASLQVSAEEVQRASGFDRIVFKHLPTGFKYEVPVMRSANDEAPVYSEYLMQAYETHCADLRNTFVRAAEKAVELGTMPRTEPVHTPPTRLQRLRWHLRYKAWRRFWQRVRGTRW